jgi:hypothetical protein
MTLEQGRNLPWFHIMRGGLAGLRPQKRDLVGKLRSRSKRPDPYVPPAFFAMAWSMAVIMRSVRRTASAARSPKVRKLASAASA